MLFTTKKKSEVTDEESMQQMMLLLDEWKAPEPSPWFDARMMARFREEQQRAPEGFFARMHSRFLLPGNTLMKPLMAGAMALAVMAGGGSYWQMTHLHAARQPVISATVEDLQVLDSNEQTIQQMDQLLDDNDDDTPIS